MPKKFPSVTVLLTLRNSVETIKSCVDSLLKIDYSNYEIFVVDAFSTDGSYETLKGYGKKIKLYQVKGWAPVAYNWALEKIKSDYIALIDADCTVPRNWLKELLSGFKTPDILEVAGICVSPQSKSRLQNLLGRELEDRFNHIGEYTNKVPSMNVAFKTSIAKKIKFREDLKVDYDADFSFKIRNCGGKIYFNKKAKIYHYHRSSWKKFFKQQFDYAVYSPLVYSSKFVLGKKGDPITKKSMAVQIMLGYFFAFGLILSLVDIRALYASLAFLIVLFSSYAYDSMRLSRSPSDFLLYIAIFFYRNTAWNLGILRGILTLKQKHTNKQPFYNQAKPKL